MDSDLCVDILKSGLEKQGGKKSHYNVFLNQNTVPHTLPIDQTKMKMKRREEKKVQMSHKLVLQVDTAVGICWTRKSVRVIFTLSADIQFTPVKLTWEIQGRFRCRFWCRKCHWQYECVRKAASWSPPSWSRPPSAIRTPTSWWWGRQTSSPGSCRSVCGGTGTSPSLPSWSHRTTFRVFEGKGASSRSAGRRTCERGFQGGGHWNRPSFGCGGAPRRWLEASLAKPLRACFLLWSFCGKPPTGAACSWSVSGACWTMLGAGTTLSRTTLSWTPGTVWWSWGFWRPSWRIYKQALTTWCQAHLTD